MLIRHSTNWIQHLCLYSRPLLLINCDSAHIWIDQFLLFHRFRFDYFRNHMSSRVSHLDRCLSPSIYRSLNGISAQSVNNKVIKIKISGAALWCEKKRKIMWTTTASNELGFQCSKRSAEMESTSGRKAYDMKACRYCRRRRQTVNTRHLQTELYYTGYVILATV